MNEARADAGSGHVRSPGLAAIGGLLHGFTTLGHGSVELGSTAGDPLSAFFSASGAAWRRCEVRQVHGAMAVDASAAGPQVEADGLVTARSGELLIIRVADCLPVLLVAQDESSKLVGVGAAHAGWRGLVAGVLGATIAHLRTCVPTNGARLLAALGPSIGPCCFEVGPEVAQPIAHEFGGAFVLAGRGDRFMVDLAGAARQQLRQLGVSVVDDSIPPCTRCRPDVYHSFRARGAQAGRMGAYVGMRSTALT